MFWAEKVSAIPAFLTRHSLLFNEHGLGKWRKWYHSFVMRFISCFADKVGCSCQVNCDFRIFKKEVPKKKLMTLYNSFSYKIAPQLITNKVNTKTIGFVGRFHEVKQLHHFIELAELLINSSVTDFSICLVGDGETKEKMESLVKAKNLIKYFNFAGFQSDTSKFFQEISIFVLPSRIESFSVALIEAQAYGIPSVVYDVGGNKEIVIDGATGYLVDLNNIEKIFTRVKLLLLNDQIWRDMSARASQNAHNNFSNEKRLQNLKNIYNLIRK